MKKIILIAGVPGIGKSYLANQISRVYPKAMYIAQDACKELLFNTVGFSNLIEKEELIEKSREMFTDISAMSLANNDVLILDYPFSYKQLDFLDSLRLDYDIKFLTLTLYGDLEVLYKRRRNRDLDGHRNNGHILDCYHGYETYTSETYPLSKIKYINACTDSGYQNFKYDQTIAIDVTDFTKVDYNQIINQVLNFINDPN